MSKPQYHDVITISDLPDGGFSRILKDASTLQAGAHNMPLKGQTIILLFFESSTRTRTSFEIAAQRLGADVVVIHADSMATVKGESFQDTLQTLAAMEPAAIVIRHPHSGAAALAARYVDVPIVNAGDGAFAHPTQALLDVFTLEQAGVNLKDKHIGICGDIVHSRVARSAIEAFLHKGARITVCGPETLLPRAGYLDGVEQSNHIDTLLPTLDVLMLLRIQKERMRAPYVPSDADYHFRYGLHADRLKKLKDGAKIIHPGPVSRGVEISGNVVNQLDKHLILNQVHYGVAVRQSVLCYATGVSL